MAERIPDLWRLQEDASRLYQLYLCQLQTHHLHARVVEASRQIRRYAAHGPGRQEGLFTFCWEIDSLCALMNYKAAWRQLRLREEIAFGKRFDLARRQWSADDGWELAVSYAPVLFFLGRYRRGCALLETAIEFWIDSGRVPSLDIHYHIYNGDQEPQHRCRVTLTHFYHRLGKGLSEWHRWEAFVSGFHPRRFRLTSVRRDELLADPGRLPFFCDRLQDLLDERITCGVGGTQSDLIDSPGKVRKRQEATQKKLDEFQEWFQPRRERTDAKLRQLFPELQELSR